VQHDWQGATLQELLRAQLGSFGGIDSKKITVQGPEIMLTPSAMQSLGIVVHELATNATKHGALSTPAGSVAISWKLDDQDGARVVWREQGGPPVTEPTHKGFGQVVFERIGASLDGNITTEFRATGLVCEITIAANNLLLAGRPAPAAGIAPHPALH
jgi:two-component sensor histidine kinase